MPQLITDHQHNTRTALAWVFSKWANLQDEYDQMPDELRQHYVDELARAMAGFSGSDFRIEGDDRINVDTFWIWLFGEALPDGVPADLIAEVEQRTQLPIWKSVDIVQTSKWMVSFAFVPKQMLPA